MFKSIKIKLLLKKYQTIIFDILGSVELENQENGKINLRDKEVNIVTLICDDKSLNFKFKNSVIEKYVTLKLPGDNDDLSDIVVFETIKENRPNGCIVEKIEKVYGFSRFSSKDRALVDLISKRCVFDKDVDFDDIIYDEDDFYLNNNSLFTTIFESHMKDFVRTVYDWRWMTDSLYSTRTLLNGQDISRLYDIVEGKDKIIRIYDLYNGIINERNSNDIFSINIGLLDKNCLGYKETVGITEKENNICGCSKNNIPYNQDCDFIHKLIQDKIGYNYAFSCSDLSSLLNAITYQMSAVERVKKSIFKDLGISYEEFIELDYDEQRNLILNYNKNHLRENNDDTVTMMIGEGEHSTFIKVKKGTSVIDFLRN